MRLPVPRPRDWLLLAVAVAVAAAAVGVVTSHPQRRIERDLPAVAAPSAALETAAPVLPRSGIATTTRSTVLRVVPSSEGEAASVLRAGIVLPVRAETKGFVRVETPCEL